MAAKRIKYMDYDFRGEGYKISVKDFISQRTGARYKIILNLNEMEYYIRNERNKEKIKTSRKHKNMNVMKREAREDLESLGVILGKEVRSRSFGLCETGYSQTKHKRLIREREE